MTKLLKYTNITKHGLCAVYCMVCVVCARVVHALTWNGGYMISNTTGSSCNCSTISKYR
jgi:hypothetical protein